MRRRRRRRLDRRAADDDQQPSFHTIRPLRDSSPNVNGGDNIQYPVKTDPPEMTWRAVLPFVL